MAVAPCGPEDRWRESTKRERDCIVLGGVLKTEQASPEWLFPSHSADDCTGFRDLGGISTIYPLLADVKALSFLYCPGRCLR